MKKSIKQRRQHDVRPECDFASMTGGVRGKYYEQYCEGTNIVRLRTDSRSFDSAPARPQKTRSEKTCGAPLRMTNFVKSDRTPA